MIAFILFLIFCQALGVSVGAFTALWGEFAYMRSMRDGKIDIAERAHLRIIGNGLRFGMFLFLLASIGLVIVAYALRITPQPAMTQEYWMIIMLAALIIAVSWALSRGHVSSVLGSATIFTAWWFLAYLTLGLFPKFSFGSVVALLTISTAVIYALFNYVRFSAGHLAKNEK